ncbi:hypothetical protein B0A55_03873 [Friedmanniomyces simplex]|uniref:Uncharacterized protein n=1 Tax=Friedmanniomyces simplex TaxID=329884 RepID=A0A4U0XU74_9PEZI|nr:hypothetical protein B0A55_03873 [Friedmanniomyces simplex]
MEEAPRATCTVAVVGLGAHGLATLKNLVEEGFDATGFDSNTYVGGIWHATSEARLSSLPTTVVNVSRERACFTDFPFPDGTSSYPTAEQVDRYLNDYCTEFDLWARLKLGTSVGNIQRDEELEKWRFDATIGDGSKVSLTFDKVVIATGPHNVPVMPTLPGSDSFQGEILHSLHFKDPAKFEGKTVVVVGMANTAVDTATGLVGTARKIYLAHRNGCALLPRIMTNGTSLDHGASYRTFAIRDVLETLFPNLAVGFIDRWVGAIQKAHFDLDPQWRINTPPPSLSKQNPTVSDTLYPALRSGSIISTHAHKQITGPHSLELEDGTLLADIDAIIFCTGYRLDLSYLGRYDPTNLNPNSTTPPQYDYDAPRLYQNILSHEHPESLAFIGLALVFFPGFVIADLNSMALAQLWKHPKELLPSKAEMQEQYARHLAWRARVKALPNTPGKGPQPLQMETGAFIKWVQGIAGTRLDEHLGYTSPAAWRLWWRDRALSRLLMDGVYSPHAYRLFDSGGRRRKWEGAREAIVRVNGDVEERRRVGKGGGGGLGGEKMVEVEVLLGDVVACS